jgi:hypothetical protein
VGLLREVYAGRRGCSVEGPLLDGKATTIERRDRKVEQVADLPFLGAVLRLSGVTVPRQVLETAFGQPVNRFEPSRVDGLNYAQVDVPIQDTPWPAIVEFVERLAPIISSLLNEAMIDDPNLDLGFVYSETDFTISQRIPSDLIAAVGRGRISITLSFYPVSASDENKA